MGMEAMASKEFSSTLHLYMLVPQPSPPAMYRSLSPETTGKQYTVSNNEDLLILYYVVMLQLSNKYNSFVTIEFILSVLFLFLYATE